MVAVFIVEKGDRVFTCLLDFVWAFVLEVILG